MKTSYRILMMFFAVMLSVVAIAQNIAINGTVSNSVTGETVSAVTITVKGSATGTFSDDKGVFRIYVKKLPATLVFSSVGYSSKEVAVSSSSTELDVKMEPMVALAQDVVVAASRTPERILESPVSIERIGVASIRNAAVPNYYEALGNLKGVDMTVSSLNFKTVSTRGFNGSGNLRFNQLIDGMDNQAPGLNFSVANLVGLTELDVDNMELLPGASSALYGSGGMNGTLLISSKNPFKYQGLSWQVKQGIMHIDENQRASAPYYDWSMRWGKKINEKWAFKVAGQFTQAKDWQAGDTSNYDRVRNSTKAGTRALPSYDGVNVYGDEINAKMLTVGQSMVAAGVLPSSALALLPISDTVSRTGYAERHMVDYNTYNVKLTGGLFYKISSTVEASLQAYWGMGTNVYTASDRYSLKDVKIGQYQAAVKGKNWNVRLYTTQENSGDSYNATIMAQLLNESWKPSTVWFPTYVGAYVTARGGGASETAAHIAARNAADQGRILPGTAAFNDAKKRIGSVAIPRGAKFNDKSDLYVAEGTYNFSELVNNVVEIQAGANFRQYVLNSEGTLFADTAGVIRINEFGGFVQVQKKILNDRVKLGASGRYDKNENFAGRFTPRFSAVIKVKEDNNVRLSYQTGYRFPSTQNQFINLNAGSARLIGGLPQFRSFYNFSGNPVYTVANVTQFGAAFQAAYVANLQQGQSVPVATANALAATGNLLQEFKFPEFKPESVKSFEIGYKGIVAKKLLIDAYYYYSKYKNFIGFQNVIQARSTPGVPPQLALLSGNTRQIYNSPVTTTNAVDAQGFGIGAEYLLPKNFIVSANLSSDQLNNVPTGFITFFNTPRYRTNISLRNDNFCKRYGFNVTYRWQDDTKYESNFVSGTTPSYGTVDAQFSVRFHDTKSILKVGASNLFNRYYRNAFGNPEVGGLYYVSYGFNVF